jgi:hypothetical protein
VVIKHAILVAAVVVATSSAARASTDRVAIARFRGVHAQRVQGVLENSLLKRFYVVPDFTVEETARRQGVGLVGDSDFAQVGKALKVRGFVSALVRKGRDWQVQLQVRRGDTGQLVGRFLVSDRRLERLESTLASRAPRRLAALFSELGEERGPLVKAVAVEAPAVPEVIESEEAPPPRREAAADEAPVRQVGEVLTLRAAGRVFNRTFTYSQNLSQLPDYHVGGAFIGVVEGTLHPFNASTGLSALGVAASLEYGIGVSAGYAGSQDRVDSKIHGYSVAARWRILGEEFTLAPELGYAAHTFVTGAPGDVAPDVNYGLVTAGADARWSPNKRISFLGRADYLHVLSAGPLLTADRFAHATVRGVSAELGLAVSVAPLWELYGAAGIRQFGFAMNSQPGDKQIAGGAVDQTTWLAVGVSYGRMTASP